MEIREYQGIELEKSNYNFLIDLENANGKQVPEISMHRHIGFRAENRNITWIRLIREDFENIPQSIGNLAQLKKLELTHMDLQEIPEEIGNLVNLEELDLSVNHLSKLPESIGNLKNLVKLNLLNNKLTELPDSFANLKNLKELRLSMNGFSIIPEPLTKLASLEYLDLSRNFLKEITTSIVKLISLQRLDLSKNKISALPNEFSTMSIKSVNLKENRLKDYSNAPKSDFLQMDGSSTVKNGRELFLRDLSELNNIPWEKIKETVLEDSIYLDLSNYNLTELPESIGNLD